MVYESIVISNFHLSAANKAKGRMAFLVKSQSVAQPF